MRLARFLAAALLAALATLGAAAFAQAVLPVPPLSGRVIDQTGTLTAAQVQAMSDKLAALETKRGTQLVVLVVSSTQPEDIAAYGQRVADQWKIGRLAVGDGLLIVVAKEDRRVRIEVAKALEGAVPDLAAKQIIGDVISPAFRKGDFAGGLNAAIDRLDARIANEGLPEPNAAPRGPLPPSGQGFQLQDIALFLFVAVPIVGAVLTGILGRKLGSLATAAAAGGMGWWLSASIAVALGVGVVALILVLVMGIGAARRGVARGTRHGGPPIIWGGGGGGGFGGGGGGFGSGGGGDFGGGGASGDW